MDMFAPAAVPWLVSSAVIAQRCRRSSSGPRCRVAAIRQTPLAATRGSRQRDARLTLNPPRATAPETTASSPAAAPRCTKSTSRQTRRKSASPTSPRPHGGIVLIRNVQRQRERRRKRAEHAHLLGHRRRRCALIERLGKKLHRHRRHEHHDDDRDRSRSGSSPSCGRCVEQNSAVIAVVTHVSATISK